MMTRSLFASLAVCVLFPLALTGCPSGGVGDPCIPEDEYRKEFSGFAATEVNVESRSFQCLTRVCLVNKFQGRVSCPYGQDHTSRDEETPSPVQHTQACTVPGTDAPINTVVNPQFISRRAERTVYCSCRCGGQDPAANYCDCPSGFECAELIQDLGLGSDQLAGSYCIRRGTNLREGEFFDRATCQWDDTADGPQDGTGSADCGTLDGSY
jgi:hypothetical protein